MLQPADNMAIEPSKLFDAVFEYLVHNCFEDSAKSLISERHGKPKISNSDRSLPLRKELTKLIQTGDILKAIEILSVNFPIIIYDSDKNMTEVLFSLQCQQFAELVRQGDITKALEFAQKVLGPYSYKHPKTLNGLQDLVALLAYDNPDKSPVSDFLTQKKRDVLADLVNSEILKLNGKPSVPALELLVKQFAVVSKELGDVPLLEDFLNQ